MALPVGDFPGQPDMQHAGQTVQELRSEAQAGDNSVGRVASCVPLVVLRQASQLLPLCKSGGTGQHHRNVR